MSTHEYTSWGVENVEKHLFDNFHNFFEVSFSSTQTLSTRASTRELWLRASAAVSLVPPYLTRPAIKSRNSASTSGRIASHGLSGKGYHISNGGVRYEVASGHVSGVGEPRVENILRMRPSWLPSSEAGRDSNSGRGPGRRRASASIVPAAQTSISGP